MIEYIIVIPARYASTRFPGKPLELINGKTMLQWTYEAAGKSQAKEIYIATDDERIYESAQAYTENVLMTSAEHQNGTERLSEVSEKLSFDDDSIIVNVQGDEPLIKAKHIDLVASTLHQSEQAGIATLCYPISTVKDLFDPNIVKVVFNEKQLALYFSRAPIPWNRNLFPGLLQDKTCEQIPSDHLTAYYRH
ncbi:MAG: 3-deoxy-manno-octulosonate cytidylyltransferase, partial [Gammaproteobacteria bacterium]|nr:3-deoxy-manno-octulosonate cytidylyltransferase [Gammaproteobacteria bacterium]